MQITDKKWSSMSIHQSLDHCYFLQVILVTSILLSCPSLVTSINKSFQLGTLPNGSTLCAVNTPLYSLSVGNVGGLSATGVPNEVPTGVPNAVRCAFLCTAGMCSGFNYIAHRELCQFFNTSSSSCIVKQNCSLYQVQLL